MLLNNWQSKRLRMKRRKKNKLKMKD